MDLDPQKLARVLGQYIAALDPALHRGISSGTADTEDGADPWLIEASFFLREWENDPGEGEKE